MVVGEAMAKVANVARRMAGTFIVSGCESAEPCMWLEAAREVDVLRYLIQKQCYGG